MRYNKRIEVITKRGEEVYNPRTRKKEKQPDEKQVISAHISPITLESSVSIFGSYDKNIFVARCLGKPRQNHVEVFYREKLYKVIRQTNYRNRFELYLELVQ